MQSCCEKWVDVYIMPYWHAAAVIKDSVDAMEVPKYCPQCRRKLLHTRDFNLEQDRIRLAPVHLPYPTGKKESK